MRQPLGDKFGVVAAEDSDSCKSSGKGAVVSKVVVTVCAQIRTDKLRHRLRCCVCSFLRGLKLSLYDVGGEIPGVDAVGGVEARKLLGSKCGKKRGGRCCCKPRRQLTTQHSWENDDSANNITCTATATSALSRITSTLENTY